MTNGWRCWKGSRGRAVLLLAGAVALAWFAWWWANLPRTPEALFRVRCSTCHELRTAKVCEFEPALRPEIVNTMRRLHGADRVISDDEALAIQGYLEELLQCP